VTAIETETLKPEDGQIGWGRVLLAGLYENLGNWPEAEAMWRAALEDAVAAEEAARAAEEAEEAVEESLTACTTVTYETAEMTRPRTRKRSTRRRRRRDDAADDDTAEDSSEEELARDPAVANEGAATPASAPAPTAEEAPTGVDETTADGEEVDYWSHWQTARTQEGLARVLEVQGRLREAEPLRRELYAYYTAMKNPALGASARRALADLLARMHERDEAARLYRKAIAELETKGETGTIEYAELLESLAGAMPRDASPEIQVQLSNTATEVRRKLIARAEEKIEFLAKEDSCEIVGIYEEWIANVTALDGAGSPALSAILERYAAYQRSLGWTAFARRTESRIDKWRGTAPSWRHW
jgi:tetratricopeptide (TPR) repeat protein